MDIKKCLIDYSKKLQIDVIGVCSPEPFENIRQVLIERQNKGYLSGFEEKDIEKRIDPRKTMENVKSIIVIGESYHIENAPNTTKRTEELYGSLSRTAWGTDYHQVLMEKLCKLGEYIEENMDGEYKAFVDTGPLIDREVAKRAGLGWQGKNCALISPILGSWFFIGYLLTNIFIEPDKPLKEEGCGGCDLCQKACPSGALCGDYEINAKECISYLTQSKEEIPFHLRSKMGRQLYGCDQCQLVCPYNKKIQKKNKDYFTPSMVQAFPSIEELAKISNYEFKQTYGKTSGGWRGKKLLQRNGIIALGNSKKESALNILEQTIKDERPMIRKYSAWAIGNLGFDKGVDILRLSLTSEKDEEVAKEIQKILKDFGRME